MNKKDKYVIYVGFVSVAVISYTALQFRFPDDYEKKIGQHAPEGRFDHGNSEFYRPIVYSMSATGATGISQDHEQIHSEISKSLDRKNV